MAKDNLGRNPSLLAGAALLIDYILTVSVSVSAGVRALTSAVPEAFDYRVLIALAAIAIITWVNLRGVRESGTIFALPTYAFVGGVLLTIGIGFAYIWLLLRAFAGGCTALTGIEAISNGVKAFQTPESKNAAKTMVAMGVMAMYLVGLFHCCPDLCCQRRHLFLRKIKNSIFNAQRFELLFQERDTWRQGGDVPVREQICIIKHRGCVAPGRYRTGSKRGLNIFGSRFGNYPQDIMLRLRYH